MGKNGNKYSVLDKNYTILGKTIMEKVVILNKDVQDQKKVRWKIGQQKVARIRNEKGLIKSMENAKKRYRMGSQKFVCVNMTNAMTVINLNII